MAGGTAGTPTFLFTDIEGSTRLLQKLGDRYSGAARRAPRAASRRRSRARAGASSARRATPSLPRSRRPLSAVTAAAEAQRALEGYDVAGGRPDPRPHRASIRGEAVETNGDYVGLAVHQVARIMSAGHGGQVLVSEATRRLDSDPARRRRAARPWGAAPEGPRRPGAALPAGHRRRSRTASRRCARSIRGPTTCPFR